MCGNEEMVRGDLMKPGCANETYQLFYAMKDQGGVMDALV